MQLQYVLTILASLTMSVAPAIAAAMPEAIPEFLESRATCIGGDHLIGAGCAPSSKGHTSCSANYGAVVSANAHSSLVSLFEEQSQVSPLRPEPRNVFNVVHFYCPES